MKHIMFSLILAFTFCLAYGQKDDYYAGKNSVTYNGVEWKITYEDNAYFLEPAVSKYGYGATRYKDGRKVPPDAVQYPFKEGSSPKTEASKAFAGHMTKLKGTILFVDYWINTETGRVEDVAFAFGIESPLTEFDISYFDNLLARIRKQVRAAKANASSKTNAYDGFVRMGDIVVFENMIDYHAPYPMI